MRVRGALNAEVAGRRLSSFAKRAVDAIGAGLGLVLLSPLFAMTAAAIALTSRGPIFFLQPRHGMNGVPFKVVKFRTFDADQSDPSGVKQTVVNDARVTPLGAALRRTSIDELPQLWNVLKGEMSLVGPRPHPIGMRAGAETYEDLVAAYSLRCLVRPGLTGLAQVRGLRGEVRSRYHARARIVSDLTYIARVGVGLDVKIIILTIMRELRGRTGS